MANIYRESSESEFESLLHSMSGHAWSSFYSYWYVKIMCLGVTKAQIISQLRGKRGPSGILGNALNSLAWTGGGRGLISGTRALVWNNEQGCIAGRLVPDVKQKHVFARIGPERTGAASRRASGRPRVSKETRKAARRFHTARQLDPAPTRNWLYFQGVTCPTNRNIRKASMCLCLMKTLVKKTHVCPPSALAGERMRKPDTDQYLFLPWWYLVIFVLFEFCGNWKKKQSTCEVFIARYKVNPGNVLSFISVIKLLLLFFLLVSAWGTQGHRGQDEEAMIW